MWGMIAKVLAGLLLSKNQRANNLYNTAMGIANSARSVPQPQARQM